MLAIAIIIVILVLFIISKYKIVKDNSLSPQEAKKILNSFDYIIDVRTKDEWNDRHYNNSISIPIDRLVFDLIPTVPNKDSKILFCCKKGIRGAGSEVIANKKGYFNINYLVGNCNDLY